jgi:hypothetical protein
MKISAGATKRVRDQQRMLGKQLIRAMFDSSGDAQRFAFERF